GGAGFGLSDARAPVGRPVELSVTAPVKPAAGVTATVYVVDAPGVTVWLAGVADSEKSGCETTSVTVVLCASVPLVPVMVTGYVPVGVLADVDTDMVDARVVGFGGHDAAAPAGRPLALSDPEPLNPPDGVTVMLYVVGLPGLTVWLVGDAATPKSGVPQPASLNVPTRVRQLKIPFAGMYSLVNQNVQS